MAEQKIRQEAKKLKTIWVTKPTPPFRQDFKLIKQLGQAGQFGITYRCVRKADKKTFAVKHLNKNRFYRIPVKHRHRYLAAMHSEIEILGTLDHPYIVGLEEVYEDKPTLYIVMEECSGGELFQRIVKKERFNEQDAARVVKQICEALKYMHEKNKIVHCDLKPDNILFKNDDEDSPIKLIDFGMAKVLPRLQYLTHLCGTPYYTAPEIIADKKFNHQCDVWSVGVILYVMLFGYPPFYVDPEQYGKNERRAIYSKIKKGFYPQVRSTDKYGYGPWFPDHIPVSADARDLMAKMMEKSVKKRFTANEVLNHPWILHGGGENKDGVVMPKSILSSLAKFSNTCTFKLVVIKLFRNQFEKMRPKHFEELEHIFKQMDKDGDGVVSYEEFQEAVATVKGLEIHKNNIESMFKELNVDDKKGIRFEDLLNALVHDYLVACDERLYAAFRELDDDDDGKITTAQLKAKLKEIDPLGEWDKAMEIIESQSLDNNGEIDYEEFLLTLHPNFDEAPIWSEKLYNLASVQQGFKDDEKEEEEEEQQKKKKHKKHKKHKKKKKKDA